MNAAATFPAVCKPHPFASDKCVTYVPEGQTLREMIGDAATDALEISVGGVNVPAHMWDKVRPRANTPVNVTVIPQGGNGGKWLRTILLIVVAIVAWEVAPYLTGEFGLFAGANTTLVAAGIALAGQLLVTPLIPPPGDRT